MPERTLDSERAKPHLHPWSRHDERALLSHLNHHHYNSMVYSKAIFLTALISLTIDLSFQSSEQLSSPTFKILYDFKIKRKMSLAANLTQENSTAINQTYPVVNVITADYKTIIMSGNGIAPIVQVEI